MLKTKLPPGVRLVSGRYYRVQYVGIVNGKRKQKVHPLTRVSEGLAALFRALASLENEPVSNDTRIPFRIKLWLQQALPDLSLEEQKETARMGAEISAAFKEFKVDQVQARHILQFLQQWTNSGKLRTAQRIGPH